MRKAHKIEVFHATLKSFPYLKISLDFLSETLLAQFKVILNMLTPQFSRAPKHLMQIHSIIVIIFRLQTFVKGNFIQMQTDMSYDGWVNAEFFWKMVKKEVERQRTSFEWLYRKTRIPKGTFSSWKNRNVIPRADEAIRIAQALEVSVEYLLTGTDQPQAPSNQAVREIAETVPFFDDYDLQTLLETVRAMTARYQRDNACRSGCPLSRRRNS